MGGMAVNDLDLARIKKWCDAQWPEELWHEAKVEADVNGNTVTLVEVRPPWDGKGEHTRWPIARLRFTQTTGLWQLYWRDRNLNFHKYDELPPSSTVQRLLNHITESKNPIFFG